MDFRLGLTGNCYDDQTVLNLAYALESEMNYKDMVVGDNNE